MQAVSSSKISIPKFKNSRAIVMLACLSTVAAKDVKAELEAKLVSDFQKPTPEFRVSFDPQSPLSQANFPQIEFKKPVVEEVVKMEDKLGDSPLSIEDKIKKNKYYRKFNDGYVVPSKKLMFLNTPSFSVRPYRIAMYFSFALLWAGYSRQIFKDITENKKTGISMKTLEGQGCRSGSWCGTAVSTGKNVDQDLLATRGITAGIVGILIAKKVADSAQEVHGNRKLSSMSAVVKNEWNKLSSVIKLRNTAIVGSIGVAAYGVLNNITALNNITYSASLCLAVYGFITLRKGQKHEINLIKKQSEVQEKEYPEEQKKNISLSMQSLSLLNTIGNIPFALIKLVENDALSTLSKIPLAMQKMADLGITNGVSMESLSSLSNLWPVVMLGCYGLILGPQTSLCIRLAKDRFMAKKANSKDSDN